MSTILLADDDPELRAVYAACLQNAGYAVVEAADGLEALAAIHAHPPALLLLDLWMPGLSGFEVLDALRHDGLSARLKVVILSCQADAEARLEAFSCGATDYLVKGIGLAELLNRIASCLGGACAEVVGPP